MKILLIISMFLTLLLSCDSPVEPKEDNFRIELYSYKAGTKDTPYPNAYFGFKINLSGDIYFLEGKTNVQGRYTILLQNHKYNYQNYQLNFGQVNYGVVEFGEVRKYVTYN